MHECVLAGLSRPPPKPLKLVKVAVNDTGV
jgi:hypothetical protein